MISEALIRMGVGFVNFFVNLMPDDDPPAWFAEGTSYLQTVWGYASGLGAWIPWNVVGVVVPSVLTAVLVGFGIKLVRLVASYFTLGGGSAG